MPWLVEAHPEAVEAEYSVNEGAGDRIEIAGTPYYFCSTAEKMSAPFTITVRGRSGHGSMPGIADNALVKAAPLIERLGQFRVEPELGPEVEALLLTVLGEVPPLDQAVELARGAHPGVAEMVEPLLSMTVSPTMIRASDKRNVIPGHVRDHRRLPPASRADAGGCRAEHPSDAR